MRTITAGVDEVCDENELRTDPEIGNYFSLKFYRVYLLKQ
jgi:hypothetical protein